MTERLAGGATLTMSELRELLGTTRKYSVPIGEYLDRIGLTRREGDVRRLNVNGAISPHRESATPEARAAALSGPSSVASFNPRRCASSR